MKRIGFLGTGQMALALAKGFLSAGVADHENLLGYDVVANSLERFTRETKGAGADSAVAVVEASDIVFLAVKPQHMDGLLAQISSQVSTKQLVVSIAAGITLEKLKRRLGDSSRLVRVMPNTPCLVGESASAYSLGGSASAEDSRIVDGLLSAVGISFELPESLLDAVTGLSGSGPAFVFVMIEALADGGVRAGLPRGIALKLAAQTVLGSAKMLLETGEHPGALKDAVASPAGTTIAGLAVLEDRGFRGAAMQAVVAAAERAKQLAGG